MTDKKSNSKENVDICLCGEYVSVCFEWLARLDLPNTAFFHFLFVFLLQQHLHMPFDGYLIPVYCALFEREKNVYWLLFICHHSSRIRCCLLLSLHLNIFVSYCTLNCNWILHGVCALHHSLTLWSYCLGSRANRKNIVEKR